MRSRGRTAVNTLTILCNGLWVVVDVDVDVQCARHPEDIDEEYGQDGNQRGEAGHRTPLEYPMHEQHEADGEKAREDVRDEHSAVVKSGFGEEVSVAFVAALLHVEGLVEAERPRGEHIGLVAPGALDAENAVYFAAFAEHIGMRFFLVPNGQRQRSQK